MKAIFETTADLKECDDIFYLVNSFIFSVATLRGAICDGIKITSTSRGFGTSDYWKQQFIVVFYLLRHALELSLKMLFKEVKGIQPPKIHDVEKLWKEVQGFKLDKNHHLEDQSGILQKAFDLLSKYHVLKDEELFRYIDSGIKQLKSLPALTNEDFDTLQRAIEIVKDAYLHVLHVKKGYSLA